MSRSLAEQRGRRGETLAALYLRAKGWRVLARRLRNPRGEVDLVVRRGHTIAFVEVKWRAKGKDLDLALDQRRIARVSAAAEACAPRFLRAGDAMRIDAVLLAPGRWPRHLVNIGQF